jgi:short subunit dehydrogenase-like uncharacterized protein
MREYQIIIYGSYGYTGRLIAQLCKQRNLTVLLSGRKTNLLKQQASELGYQFEEVEIDDRPALLNLLQKGKLVIHCGGPFQHTAKQMAEACLETQTHYTDITGEIPVFEKLASFDAQAKQRGIVIMPGVGFDVVPSDCLAVHLKNRLPDATHLQLAFTMSKGGLSRGTAKTMIEGMGYGGLVRENGKLVSIPLGTRVQKINFGTFQRHAICIPWGDVSTAWQSTGIPNIEVYSGVPVSTIRLARLSKWFNGILRLRWVKDLLLKEIDKRSPGPSEKQRENGRSYLWGKVWNERGDEAQARLETSSGYKLTAQTAVLIAEKLINAPVRPGYFTPGSYFGEKLILEVEGTIVSEGTDEVTLT